MPATTDTVPANAEAAVPANAEGAPSTKQDESAESVAATPKTESLILCHPGPSSMVPSLSCFVLKLETYLRIADIPYEEEFSFKKSSKDKIPFIKHSGKEISDTNFIMAYLNKDYEKDLNASLSEQDKAISLAFKRLIEENLYWTLAHYRWIENWSTYSKMLPVTGIRKKFLPISGALWYKPSIKSNLYGHGIGRHSNEEIGHIMEQDMHALSSHLGTKQFFMGDQPTEIDASLFGFLAQVVYAAPDSPHEKLVKECLQNLYQYTERMRETYFPDWKEKVLHEKKKEEETTGDKKDTTDAANGDGNQTDTDSRDKKEEKVEENASKSEEVAQDGKDKKEETVEEKASKPEEVAQDGKDKKEETVEEKASKPEEVAQDVGADTDGNDKEEGVKESATTFQVCE